MSEQAGDTLALSAIAIFLGAPWVIFKTIEKHEEEEEEINKLWDEIAEVEKKGKEVDYLTFNEVCGGFARLSAEWMNKHKNKNYTKAEIDEFANKISQDGTSLDVKKWFDGSEHNVHRMKELFETAAGMKFDCWCLFSVYAKGESTLSSKAFRDAYKDAAAEHAKQNEHGFWRSFASCGMR